MQYSAFDLNSYHFLLLRRTFSGKYLYYILLSKQKYLFKLKISTSAREYYEFLSKFLGEIRWRLCLHQIESFKLSFLKWCVCFGLLRIHMHYIVYKTMFWFPSELIRDKWLSSPEKLFISSLTIDNLWLSDIYHNICKELSQ